MVIHKGRGANKLADSLARMAKEISEHIVFITFVFCPTFP